MAIDVRAEQRKGIADYREYIRKEEALRPLSTSDDMSAEIERLCATIERHKGENNHAQRTIA